MAGSYSTLDTPVLFRVERSTGDVFTDGAFMPSGADIAERINVSELVEPGDVVELDPNKPHHYRKARYNSPLIAGVIATDPGIVLGNNLKKIETTASKDTSGISDFGRPRLALMGRIPVKATCENGPIKAGDLLTVSSKPGFAMRCNDAKQCQRSIIGKALEELKREEGLILVMVIAR